MRQIIDEIERAAGHVLNAQGLKAVYEATDMPDSEDDMVSFLHSSGAKSVVSVQISSRHPSLDSASVSVDIIKSRELEGGWSYVRYEGILSFPDAESREALMGQIVKALEENEGAFNLSDGSHPKVITHPLLGIALETINEFAAETGTDLSVRPFRLEDKEGLEVVANDGRAIRIEAMPGSIAMIAAGERIVISNRTEGNISEMLGSILAQTIPSPGIRP